MIDANDITEAFCPLLGRRVVLRGLADEALNGAAGTAIDFAYTERNERDTEWLGESGRYTVKLDGKGERLVQARAEEVEEEEDDWSVGVGGGGGGGGGGGPQAKGKGKGKGKGKAKGKGRGQK